MERDMTKGSPLLVILKFTLPLIIGNIFQQLYYEDEEEEDGEEE